MNYLHFNQKELQVWDMAQNIKLTKLTLQHLGQVLIPLLVYLKTRAKGL